MEHTTDEIKYITQYSVSDVLTGGKGATVFAVVELYVKSHPGISFTELQSAFPDFLVMPGFGKLIRKIEDVSKNEWNGCRFKKQPVVLSDGQKVVVTNQWKPSNMNNFIKGAQKLGIDVKPIE